MTKQPEHVDLIPYDEVFDILHKRFKATHDELRYWIKLSLDYVNLVNSKNRDEHGDFVFSLDESTSLLFPYATDLPYKGQLIAPPDNFFYPECYFYGNKLVNAFVPEPILRFVYQKDLSGLRNWNDSYSGVSKTLLKANEYGILRFYNSDVDEFTSSATRSNNLWCHTFEGESYVTEPDKFFLLYEILNVERVFFKRNRDECLKELGEKNIELPPNVVKFKK